MVNGKIMVTLVAGSLSLVGTTIFNVQKEASVIENNTQIRILSSSGVPRQDIIVVAGKNNYLPDQFGTIFIGTKYNGMVDVFCMNKPRKLLAQIQLSGTASITIDKKCS